MDKIKELKAMAYDIMANMEFLKGKLSEVNNAIAKLSKEEKDKENGTGDSSDVN